VSIKEQFTETLLTESGREPKVGNGRRRGGQPEETTGSLKIRKPTSILQMSSGRSGSSPDSGSWVAVPPRRRGLEVSVRPEVAVSLTGLLSFER
jgi:hypothetical protein